MYEGQEDLMSRQEILKNSHGEVQQYVADNLKALTREKALIAAGNKQLMDMTESIRAKLGENVLGAKLSELRKTLFVKNGERNKIWGQKNEYRTRSKIFQAVMFRTDKNILLFQISCNISS